MKTREQQKTSGDADVALTLKDEIRVDRGVIQLESLYLTTVPTSGSAYFEQAIDDKLKC